MTSLMFDEAEGHEGGISLCCDVSGTSGSLVLQIGFEQQAQPDVSGFTDTRVPSVASVPADSCSLPVGRSTHAHLAASAGAVHS